MSDGSGWVKIHRKLWDNPIVVKDPARIATWIWLITHATHRPYDTLFGGQRFTLQPGQLVVGRRRLAKILGISDSKMQRILNEFKNDQQIEQRSTPYGSVISIVNWHKYQDGEPQNEPPSNHRRTTSEPPSITIQEHKNEKEVVVDARARASGSRCLSDRLSDDEWNRLDRQFDLFLDLIDRIDDQVTDPDAIESPYAYFLRAANNLNWPRK